MNSRIEIGSPTFPTVPGSLTSSKETIEAGVITLQSKKGIWTAVSVSERIAILDTLIGDCARTASRWVDACNSAQGIAPDSIAAGDNWISGPYSVVRFLRALWRSLGDISAGGRPKISGPITTREDGQVVARVFPETVYDRLFFAGLTMDVWMQPGITERDLSLTQALPYQEQHPEGKVALVLAAGNASASGPTDMLSKLFVENQVVLLKLSPVNAYIGTFIEESFRALTDLGFLRIVYGGAEEGSYLCNHPGIDEIHVTGSDKTLEAIVFGSGPEAARRKLEGRPLLTKRFTAELGNVGPLIVVPGPWSSGDLAYQAEHIVTTMVNNAGFNCDASRLILNHATWEQRQQLLQQMRLLMGKIPLRDAYYPGTNSRHSDFLEAHPEAEVFGKPSEHQLPWTFISDVNPKNRADVCFTTEPFCGLIAETGIEAKTVVEYIDRAVEFANECLWGTLNITIIVHPTSLKDRAVEEAVARAIANLRYGAIGLNYWSASVYVAGTCPWGAFPGHTVDNIQSGTGVVHNALMFSTPQKTVLRAPFRSRPTPVWFATRGKAGRKVFKRLVEFEASPSPIKVPGIAWTAIRG